MWLTSGRVSGRKTLLQYSSLTPLERECYEGEPYRKTDYKPIIYIYNVLVLSHWLHEMLESNDLTVNRPLEQCYAHVGLIHTNTVLQIIFSLTMCLCQLLLYALFNHPGCYSRFSGSRKLSSHIVLAGLFHKLSGVKAVGLLLCLPTPLTLVCGGVRSSRLWSTSQHISPYGQQLHHSSGVCPQIQEWQCGAYVGAVEEMVWMLQRGHSGDGCVLALTLCKYDLRKGDLVVLG